MERLTREEVASLIERARSGERAAFDALVRAHHLALIGHIRGRCNISREDAEALAQDIWIQAWEDFGKPAENGGYDPAKGAFYTFITNRYARFCIRRFFQRRGPVLESLDAYPDGGTQPLRTPEIDVEEARERAAIYRALFRVTFLCGGYPHQQLAFGCSKLLYGVPSPRGIEGDPAGMDRDFGTVPLGVLTQRFWQAYATQSALNPEDLDELHTCLSPLESRLRLATGDLVKPLPSHLEPLRGQVTGTTCFRNYYTERGASAAVSDWCDKVQRRIRAAVGAGDDAEHPDDGAVCGRCKLRHVPPCGVRRPI